MSEKKSNVKKAGRAKRSRLGRGLSALVDAPVVVEIEDNSRSDNLSNQSGGRVSGAGGVEGAVGAAGAEGTGGVVGAGGVEGVGEGSGVTGVLETRGVGVDEGADGSLAGGDDGRPAGAQSTNLRQGGLGDGVDANQTGVQGALGGADVLVGGEVVEIGVGLIGVNRDQPRRVFDEGALGELAASIVEHGLMQPVVVRMRAAKQQSSRAADEEKTRLAEDGQAVAPEGRGGEGVVYELIAGERRWRACRLAGLETIPAIVREADDVTSAQLALIENVQREDLNVVELAEGYRVLADRYSMTQERIAKVVGVSRSLVANTVRLLDLPVEVRNLIVEGKLSSGHGKVLLSLGVPGKQRKFAARCLKEGWNVRQLQRACDDVVDGTDVGRESQHKVGSNPEDNRALSVLRDLEKRVGEELGTRVKIRTDKSRTRGRVVIEFFDLDQFDGLLGRLGVNMEE